LRHQLNPINDFIIDSIAINRFAIIDQFVSTQLCHSLQADLDALDRAGDFHKAGIGHGTNLDTKTAVRGDRISWFDPAKLTAAQSDLWLKLEELRFALNRKLYLGLDHFEAHYAVYKPGAAYAPHLDRFKDDDRRVVSAILYLNDAWQESDGGQLRLGNQGTTLVEPLAARLLTFLSGEMMHEVLKTNRERRSVSVWFRRP
jgi:SM-20-related protein